MSRRGGIAAGFLAGRASAVGAGRASVGRGTALLDLERLDHAHLLALGLELGLAVGVDLLLGEVVGTASGCRRERLHVN